MEFECSSLNEAKVFIRSSLKSKFSNSEIQLISKTYLSKLLNISPQDYMISGEISLSSNDRKSIKELVSRLLSQEPFQYIVNETEFYGLELKCDKRALIPRPETEELVDWVLELHANAQNILDLCSGSGCIALALKSQLPSSQVIAMEYSEEACELMLENCAITNQKIEIVQRDVLNKLSFKDFQEFSFDVWVSNPPYIPLSDKTKMDRNVVDFEPSMALFVMDDDPLLFYKEIAVNAKRFLRPEGSLFFEIHEEYSKDVFSLLNNLDFVNIELRKDLQGRPRMIRAQNRIFTA